MSILFQCDRCGYEEWREPDQEPWLCVVCGWMRWREVDLDGGGRSTDRNGADERTDLSRRSGR